MKSQGFWDSHTKNPKNPNEMIGFGDSVVRAERFLPAWVLFCGGRRLCQRWSSLRGGDKKDTRSHQAKWQARERAERGTQGNGGREQEGEGRRKERNRTDEQRLKKEGDEWVLGGGLSIYIYIYKRDPPALGEAECFRRATASQLLLPQKSWQMAYGVYSQISIASHSSRSWDGSRGAEGELFSRKMWHSTPCCGGLGPVLLWLALCTGVQLVKAAAGQAAGTSTLFSPWIQT